MERRISRTRQSGQSLVECALVLPLLLLLIVNVVNFGDFFYAFIAVSDATRSAGQYYSTGSVAVGGGAAPSAASVTTLVTNILRGLRNQNSIQVCVSMSNSVNVTCNQGTAPASAPPAADTPEGNPAVTYVIAAVDVTYRYQPMIPSWSFPGLNVFLTLPPTTIHQQAKMRVLQ